MASLKTNMIQLIHAMINENAKEKTILSLLHPILALLKDSKTKILDTAEGRDQSMIFVAMLFGKHKILRTERNQILVEEFYNEAIQHLQLKPSPSSK